jgi:[protein-PII] uridylyltransferase
VTETLRRSEQRQRRAGAADERLRSLWHEATTFLGVSSTGVALAAVGGYGRSELSPASDLDVVLLSRDDYDASALEALAHALWYPLWDDAVALDHSVRTQSELRDAAAADLRVALATLDIRQVAGDPTQTQSSRGQRVADWRRAAKSRLLDLAALTRDRWERVGDLAHATTPDLKESRGGTRDVSLLRALLATWLIDVPAAELVRLHNALLEVRDALHETTGRSSDRLVVDYAAEVAERLGLRDAAQLRSELVTTGRGIAHLSSVALRNVDWLLARPPTGALRRPLLDSLAPGVAAHRGEVVLTDRAQPHRDPLLGLRTAEAAASADLVLANSAAARLGREMAPMPVPWPTEARLLLTSMLGVGSALVDVWESLDQYGVVERLLPEWARVRYRAPESPVHRFTVDRHLVQTCVEAAPLLGSVDRPDLLVVACLLHDIGKGDDGDHSVNGERIAGDIAGRIGFCRADAAVITTLVRHHLLLVETATSADLDDPRTSEAVALAVGQATTLEMLAVLTEADALATGPQAWSAWRKHLLDTLVDRVRGTLRRQQLRHDVATAGIHVDG